MTARKITSVRLGLGDLAFLRRNRLPLAEQLRQDLALVRALEEALDCEGGDKLRVRDVRRLVRSQGS